MILALSGFNGLQGTAYIPQLSNHYDISEHDDFLRLSVKSLTKHMCSLKFTTYACHGIIFG
jgi:hypothetical protein